MEEQIYKLIFDENEITWQSLLMELVREEGMDPWDIDISKLAKSYIDQVRKMKLANLKISGKVVLASALLLKVKSKRLIGHEIEQLDKLFQQTQEQAVYSENFDDVDLLEPLFAQEDSETPLYPRTPQPRKRKVSVFELVEALEKAMDVRKRRIVRALPAAQRKLRLPDAIDISEVIVGVYNQIKDYFKTNGKKALTFTQLLPSQDRESKVYTFIPLLHLSSERRVNLNQKDHFGEIEIELLKRKKKVAS
ncbi:segregation/condensation protein A [Candidatus Woesearchaeota archaeon]|nr:segregation/condensation protein A [Candidatus Woesearchaeota archaeon]MBW3014470.1 segregation/condensation protein A [Candidatus Woesearchaeota archaeon]